MLDQITRTITHIIKKCKKKSSKFPKLEIKKVAPQNSKIITLMIDHIAIAFDNLS
jgi:hypothetical protein